jgi:nucleoid-associated protein YgaU
MKMPSIIRRKKLQASTARRSRALGLPSDMNYEQMAEPNMKLSRALLIVLVLHIVAVAGIIAFNTIKTRETMTAAAPGALAAATPASPIATSAEPAAIQPNEVSAVAATAPGKAPEKAAADTRPATLKTTGVTDSGKFHTVVKGENPVTIARHLHVPYDALLELNGITDPRKLQIGQKLRIPAATIATKHKSD